MTSRDELSAWFDEGLHQKATHMVVVLDEFDFEDFPVYVTAEEDVRVIVADFTAKPLYRVMEVYNLAMDKESQIAVPCVFNY